MRAARPRSPNGAGSSSRAPDRSPAPATRAFRFGVSVNQPRPKSAWIALAQRVERLGYDTLVMPDHFGPRFTIAPALVLATHATTRLRVGSFVYDNDFRHPALVAQEIATIDVLAEAASISALVPDG